MLGLLLGALGPIGWIVGGVVTVATIAAASSESKGLEDPRIIRMRRDLALAEAKSEKDIAEVKQNAQRKVTMRNQLKNTLTADLALTINSCSVFPESSEARISFDFNDIRNFCDEDRYSPPEAALLLTFSHLDWDDEQLSDIVDAMGKYSLMTIAFGDHLDSAYEEEIEEMKKLSKEINKLEQVLSQIEETV